MRLTNLLRTCLGRQLASASERQSHEITASMVGDEPRGSGIAHSVRGNATQFILLNISLAVATVILEPLPLFQALAERGDKSRQRKELPELASAELFSASCPKSGFQFPQRTMISVLLVIISIAPAILGLVGIYIFDRAQLALATLRLEKAYRNNLPSHVSQKPRIPAASAAA